MGPLAILLPALLPVAADLLKNIVGRFTGNTKPVNVDEQIKLMSAESEKLKALAELDKPIGTPSQWVVDMRAAFRYVAAGFLVPAPFLLVLVDGTGTTIAPEFIGVAFELCGSAFSFIFGERMYLGLKSFSKK
jgi:hypothetical protein